MASILPKTSFSSPNTFGDTAILSHRANLERIIRARLGQSALRITWTNTRTASGVLQKKKKKKEKKAAYFSYSYKPAAAAPVYLLYFYLKNNNLIIYTGCTETTHNTRRDSVTYIEFHLIIQDDLTV